MANEIYDSTWWGNTIDTASSIGTSTEMIQGQFNLTKLGDELVTNGDFATDSDWNLGQGQWTISNGFAVADNASNNLHTNLPIASAVGLQHKITFTLQDVTQGYVKVGLSNINPTQFNSDGTYTLYIKSTGNRFLYFDPTGFTGKLTNVSVKEARAEEVEAVKCLADAIHRIGIQDIQN